MDDLLLDPEALKATFVAFRELIEYFTASSSSQAREVRTKLRETTNGGDTFLSSLCQDLGDICAHCDVANGLERSDGSAQADIRSILSCLASVVALPSLDDVSIWSAPI